MHARASFRPRLYFALLALLACVEPPVSPARRVPAGIAKNAGDAQTAGVASAVATAPSVLVTDSDGNPLRDVAVTFAVTAGGGSVSGPSRTTNAAGIAIVGGWTLGTTVGTANNTLTATAGTLSAAFVASAIPGPVHHFVVEAQAGGPIGPQFAGAPFSVKITAQDAFNNTATGFTGTANITSNRAGSAGLSTTAAFTAGVLASHSITLTAPGAGSTITATRTGGTPAGTSAVFLVNAGPVHHFLVESQAGGAIGAQMIGTPFEVKITAQDVANNTVAAFAGTVDVTSNRAASAGLGTSAGFIAGVLEHHSVTLTETGTPTTITATRTGGAEVGTSATFIVNPGLVHHFDVQGSSGSIATQTAGSAFSITITARDAGNNVATGFTGTVNVTSNRAGSAGLGTSAAFVQGVLAAHSVTLTQSGAGSTITATRTSGGSQSGVSNAFTVNAGPLHHFRVEGAGGGTIATQPQNVAFNIRVTAEDIGDNTVAAFTGAGNTVNLTSTGTLSAGAGTTATFVSGVLASHSVTVSNVGTFSITATRTGGTEAGTSNAFDVVAPPAMTASLPANGATGVDATTNIVITFSNSVTATTSSFTIQCPSGSASIPYTVSGSPGAVITLNPATDLQIGAACEVILIAAQITDAFGLHPIANQSFSFTTALTANDDVYPETVIGNVSVNSANVTSPFSVTTNDVLGAATPIASFGSAIGSNDHVSANGGQIVMTTSGADRGKFTYNPPVAFEGTDTFSYRLAAGGVTSDATVTLTVSAPVWFIDNNASCGGACDGRLGTPFNSLAAFNAVNEGDVGQPLEGQTIFIFQSATPYVGPVTLLNSQTLAGQDATTSLATLYGMTPPSGSTPFPAMNSGDGTLVTIAGASGGVVLRNNGGATLRGFTIATTGGNALASQTNFNALTFANGTSEAPDVTINATGGGAIRLTRGSGTGTLSGVIASASSTGGQNGIHLQNVAGSLTINGGALSGGSIATFSVSGGAANLAYGGSIAQTTAATAATINVRNGGTLVLSGPISCTASCTGLSAGSNTGGTVTFSNVSKTVTAVNLTTNTGATFNFTNGGLTVTGGPAIGAFTATGGGTLSVSGGGNVINAATRAVNFSGVTIGASGLTFVSTSSSSSTTTSVTITNVSNTSGSAINLGGGTLTGATGNAFDVSSGMVPVNYGGTISKTTATAGRIVSITGRGADVTLSGDLNCTTGCTGINVSNLTGGTVTFSGASKTISIGASTAVNLNDNGAGVVYFQGGGLAITTSSGNGITATLSGTLRVDGANNTIQTATTGRALVVDDVTIGTGGLIFQSISTATDLVSSTANGIFLDNTGGTAGLTITGAGGACSQATPTCSGGRIGATVGSDGAIEGIGIYLHNTLNPSFTRVRIDGTHENFGLFGDGVTGLTLDNVLMDGVFGDNGAENEGALSLLNLAGTGTVTAGHFANGIWNNVRVRTTSATLNGLAFAGTTFGFTQTGANAALQVVSDGGTSTVTVNGASQFLGAHEANVEYIANGGTPNLVLQNNSFANAQPSGSATFRHVSISAGSAGADASGNVSYTVSSNTMTGSQEAAISMLKDRGTQTIVGSIVGNQIGDVTANSGALAPAILVRHAAGGTHRSLIDQNVLRNYNAPAAIDALFIDPSGGALPNDGSLHLTITRNTLSNPGTTVAANVDGVRLTPNTSSGSHTMCVNFGSGGLPNTLTSSFTGLGTPFAFGPVSAGGTGFFKMLGLGTLTSAGVRTLGETDNGLAGGSGFVNLTNVTILAANGAGGAACQLMTP